MSTRRHIASAPDDPLWYKDAVIYEVHVRAFFDSNDDGIGDFRGLTASSTTSRISASTPSGCCRSIRRRGATTATTSPTTATSIRTTARAPTSAASSRGAPARAARHHRAGHQPHLRPASVVPGRAARAAGLAASAISTSGATIRQKYAGTRIIFTDTETSNWALGPGREAVLLAPLLQPPARPEFRQPAGRARGDRASCASGSTGRGRAAARCHSLSGRARGHQQREPARDARRREAHPQR